MRVYFAVLSRTRRIVVGGVTGLPVAAVMVSAQLGAPTPASAAVVNDAPSAATEADALIIAATYGHAVTADVDTTETSTTEVLPDGSLRVTEWTDPVRVKSDSGRWTDVDEALHPGPDGALAPTASPVEVRFSGGGTAPLAVLETSSGAPVSLSWSAGALPAPSVQGAAATYSEVYPGVDLRLTATTTGMSEVLIVKNAEAAANPDLRSVDFGVSGAALASHAGGTVSASATDGSMVLSPAPTGWDSDKGGGVSGPGGFGTKTPVPVTVQGDTETVDAAALAMSADLTFPVFVDPDFSVGYVNRTFTDKAHPDVAYWNGSGASDAWQHVGYIDGGHSDDGLDHFARAYWQMPTAKFAGRGIGSATFKTGLVWSSSCSPRTVTLSSTSSVSSATTWNNQPDSSYVVQDSQSIAAGYNSSCEPTTAKFNATNAIQTAADNSQPYVYLMLTASETDWLAWKKFDGNASIQVTYHTKPTFVGTFDSSCTRTPGLASLDRLDAGDVRYSYNGDYALTMQTDGNLVLYRTSADNSIANPQAATWSTHTNGNPGAWAVFESDGNLRVHRPTDGTAIWTSATTATGGDYLDLQDNGNLAIYDDFGTALWNAGTGQAISGISVFCYSHANIDHYFQATATTNGITDSGGNTPNESIDYHIQYIHDGDTIDKPASNAPSGVAWHYRFDHFTGNGAYDWRIQACVHLTTVCTWSPYKRTYEFFDSSGSSPAAPTVSVTGPVSTVVGSYVGKVGTDADTVTLTPPTSTATVSRPYGYLYSVSGGSYPAGSSPALPSVSSGCNNPLGSGGYTMVCGRLGRDISSGPMTISAAAVDNRSNLLLVAFDIYGNVSPTASFVNLYAAGDTNGVNAGHSWPVLGSDGTGSTCPPSSVVDTAANATASTSLTLGSGVCQRPTTSPSTAPDGTFPATDLHFSGSANASVSAQILDTGAAATFSVGAWLNPAHAGANATDVVDTALSGRGTQTSRFMLQNAHNHWRFCMPAKDATSPYLTCVQSAATVQVNSWTFVVGTYDAVNQQLRIYVSSDGKGSSGVPAVYRSAMPASQPTALDVGAGYSGGTAGYYWDGEMSQPFAVQAALTSYQLGDIGSLFMPPATARP